MIRKYVNGQDQSFRLILQGDYGKDPDDVFALLNLHKNVDCVIANLYQSKMRARLAKSVLRDLGHNNIPVYAGSNVGEGVITIADYEFDYPNLVEESSIIMDGNPYLTILQDGMPSVIVANSAMTDLAVFFMDHYDENKHNIHLIVLQGGYEVDETKYITPNCAANNAFDYYSAQMCYDIIQQKDIPTVVITKQIAYDNPMPIDTYSQLGDGTVPQYLEKIRFKSLQEMYKLAILPSGDPNRQGFPDDRDANWFFKFVAKKPLPAILPEPNDINNYISNLNVYDVFTAMYVNSYMPHNQFDHIRVKNKFCEAVAKKNINYPKWILQHSLQSLE
jgi:hypothetical protein